MAFTTARTWVAGELVTAALMNTYIRDNQTALKAPPQDIYSTGAYGTTSTTSTSFVNTDATNLSLDITTTGGRILIIFNGLVSHGGVADNAQFDFAINGSRIGDTTHGLGARGISTSSVQFQCNYVILTGAQGAGAYNVKVMWRSVAGNSITLQSNVLFHICEI